MSEQTASERAVLDVFRQTVQEIGADTVFGEPVTRGETTIIPVARISGGGGGGGGGSAPDAGQHGGGSGSGLKVSAQPCGVFVLHGDQVQWRPSLDLNRVILGAQLVAVVVLLTVRTLVKTRRGGRRRPVLLRRG